MVTDLHDGFSLFNLLGLKSIVTFRHHGAISRKFAYEVAKELNKGSQDVTENLVGFDGQVMKVMDLIDIGTNNVLMIGIHGLGGIGKTTLAKVIYNRILESFDHYCFVADVRANVDRHGTKGLQNQLVSDLLKTNEIVGDGEKIIKERFCKKKVLILLDDVGDFEQIKKLIISPDCFDSGSRIIITTRNKEIFSGFDDCRTYAVDELDSVSSLKLFSKHAFKSDWPSKDFYDLSVKFVKILGGLPLLIEVVGFTSIQKV